MFNSVQRILASLELPSKSLARAPFSSATQRFEVPVLTTERYLSILRSAGDQLFLLEQFGNVVSGVADSNEALQEQQASDVKKVMDGLTITATSFVNNAENLKDANAALKSAVDMQQEVKVRSSSTRGWPLETNALYRISR